MPSPRPNWGSITGLEIKTAEIAMLERVTDSGRPPDKTCQPIANCGILDVAQSGESHDDDRGIIFAAGGVGGDHQLFGGIRFPTLRRAVGRLPDGLTEPEPAFFAVDIADITVASRE